MNYFLLNVYFYLVILTAIRLGDWIGFLFVAVAYGALLTWLQSE
jgi:hypothetical protein